MSLNLANNNGTHSIGYNHQRYQFRRRILRFLLRTIAANLLIKIDRVEGLENIPKAGPAILMINHIAFVDPLIVVHIAPRNIVPLAKIEVYDYPFIGIIPRLWGVIPIQREEVDRQTVKKILDVLRAGEIILVAPEGTRHPELGPTKVGIAYIALRSMAPIVPITIEGSTGFPAFRLSSRWRQPGAIVRVGHPFRYRPGIRSSSHDLLRKMTDEAMYVLAAMLSPELRGIYSDLENATQETIEFL